MPYASPNQKIYDSSDLPMLKAEHQTLEARLIELRRHPSISPEEKYEERFIKKRKRFIKNHLDSLEVRN